MILFVEKKHINFLRRAAKWVLLSRHWKKFTKIFIELFIKLSIVSQKVIVLCYASVAFFTKISVRSKFINIHLRSQSRNCGAKIRNFCRIRSRT